MLNPPRPPSIHKPALLRAKFETAVPKTLCAAIAVVFISSCSESDSESTKPADPDLPPAAGSSSSDQIEPPALHAVNEDTTPKAAEEIFSPEILLEIEQVRSTFSEATNLGELTRSEDYRKWRNEVLPEFNWQERMGGYFQAQLKTVAIAKGMDISQGLPVHVKELPVDEEAVKRAIGYAITGEVDAYTRELKRSVDILINLSIAAPTDQPLEFVQ